ncbi:hypothetical protein ACJVC5_02315 [Peredibacter sp. HCB2-198]|uniref:hypothetical protein n=1 Tax=Peredibacter sp. HCB2-198 TaxID=3383025 RepID=UPI0038B6A836
MKFKLFLLSLFITSNVQAMEMYLLDTKIQNTNFKDFLILNSVKKTVAGTLTVPGQFTTKILNVKADKQKISFDISAIENNSPLKGSYELLSSNGFKNLKGKLIIEGRTYSIIGKRIYAE